MSVSKQQVAALYAAVFNRAPDQSGLEYWVANAESFENMALGFVAHPVFEKTYGELSNEDFVKAIYENVLQGAGDDEGVSFWVGALDGGLGRAEFLASFLDAALNYDGDDVDALARKAALDNQVEVGLYFTETMGEKSNLDPNTDVGSLDIEDDAAYQAAQATIADVTADPASVEAAKAAIDEAADEDGAEEAIIEALETYQAALDAKAAAVKAQDKVVDKAVKAGLIESTSEDVVADLAQAIENKETGVRNASKIKDEAQIAEAAAITDEAIAFARDGLVREVALVQKQVDALKAKNPDAVALQEKLEGYKTVAAEMNEVVVTANSEFAKYAVANGIEVAATVGFVGDKFTATVTDKITFAFDKNGKLELQNTTGEKASDVDIKAFNESKDAEAVKAAFQNVYGNIAKEAAALKSIDSALIAALKAEGFKPYTTVDGGLKSANWSLAITDGQLASGFTLTTKVEKNDSGKLVSAEKALVISSEGTTLALYSVEDAKGGTVKVTNAGQLSDSIFSSEAAENKSSIGVIAAGSAKAVGEKANAEKAVKAFDKAVKEYHDAKAIEAEYADSVTAVEDAGTAVADAEKAFEELGVNLVKVEEGEAGGELYNEDDEDQLVDLFVYSGDKLKVTNFDGEDAFYFGDKAAALVVADKANLAAGKQLGGDANVLEIFAVQNGANTDLYVEKAAFAGNSSNAVDGSNKDFVKIELVGVNAEDLQFNDGFLTFA